MKSIVSPEVARSEGSERSGTNHAWQMFCLDPRDQVVKEVCAEGFPRARKAAPKLIDPKAGVVRIAITGPAIPKKYESDFKPIQIRGETHTCFIIAA